MTYYAVIDTNILVSAMMSRHADSATVQIVDKMIEGLIIPVYSDEIMDEYREVLHRKKFKFSSNLVEYILSAIRIYGIDVSPTPIGEVLPDMKDLPFYEVVYEKKDEGAYLVTGNLKHFPVKPFIVTARQMLNIISGKEAPGDLTGLD